MWSVLQQRWWHGKLQRNPKVLATAVISLQIDLIFCAPTGINFFPLDIYFFAKLIIYIFFCLVQKSVTVCFQSILLVSKRLLIILLSHSKFFIGHCTHPLFLGTFSFAASSRIYYFFAKWTLKDCQQVSCLLQFSIFLVIATSTQSWKKGCQESSWVSKHWLGKKCSQNTLWSYYSRISAIFRLEALKLHRVVDSPLLKCFILEHSVFKTKHYDATHEGLTE